MRRFARLAPFIVLLLLVLTPLRLVATTRMAPPIDPSGQGKPLLTPTVSVIKCGVPVPVDAILARNTIYPDPATCNHNPTGDELARRIAVTGPTAIYAPDSGTPTPTPAPAPPSAPSPSHAFSAFSVADAPSLQQTIPLDQSSGFNVHNISQKVGLQVDASVLISNYYPFDARTFQFLKPIVLPPSRSCIYATVYHIRNDPTRGSVDNIAGIDQCAHTGYAWSLHDPNAVAQLVRNDQYGNAIARIMAEQTGLVPACFQAKVYNFTLASWTISASSCQTTAQLSGSISLQAGPMEGPPLYCPAVSYNAYATNILKKTGDTWAQMPLSDLYAGYVGHCTTGNGGTWYANKYLNGAGTTELVFFQ